MRPQRWPHAALWFAVAVGCAPPAIAADVTPLEALAESARTQSYSHRVRFSYVSKSTPTFAKPEEAHGRYSRWDSLVRVEGTVAYQDKERPPLEYVSIINSDHWVRTNNPSSSRCRRMGAKATDDRLASILSDSDSSGALDGYFGTGSEGIATAMQAGEQLAEEAPEILLGKACRVLSAKTKYGHAKVWLSTSERMLLRKASLSKGQNDIYEGKKTIAAMNAESPWKEGTENWTQHFDVSMEVRETAEIEGQLVPVSGVRKTSRMGGDGSHRDNVIEYVRSDIHLFTTEPAIATFELRVPDGTSISNFDDFRSETDYQWRGGRIQPVTSGSGPNSAGSMLTRVDLWILFALLLAVAGWATWRFRRGRFSRS